MRLADEVPAVVLSLVVAVIDMVAIVELSMRAQIEPSMFTPAGPWLIVAVLTSIGAATLMLAQRSVKRLLVLSSIEDCGFLLLGVASLSTLGRDGLVLAAASHALGKSLLFVSIARPEHDGALGDGNTGLATDYPYSAFGFLMGMLAMLGIPPMLGFAGRWKLYETALQIHPALLIGFVLASILSLFAYVQAFTSMWWGIPHAEKRQAPGDEPGHAPDKSSLPLRHESLILKTVVVGLFISLLAAGLWPQFIMDGFRGGRP